MDLQRIDTRAAVPLKRVGCAYVIFVKLGDEICYLGSANDQNDLAALSESLFSDFGEVELKVIPTGDWVKIDALRGRDEREEEQRPKKTKRAQPNIASTLPKTLERQSERSESQVERGEEQRLAVQNDLSKTGAPSGVERERQMRENAAMQREKEMMNSANGGSSSSRAKDSQPVSETVRPLSEDQIKRMTERKSGTQTRQSAVTQTPVKPTLSIIDQAMEKERQMASSFASSYDSDPDSESDGES